MKIVADNTVPYLKGIAEPVAEVKYLNSNEFTPSTIHDADALIVRSIDKCTRELLQGSRVTLITTATIGFDHIDIKYCDEAGITWKNAPGCNAVSVAQYVLASLITIALRRGETLQGKTIGIVGVGHVGKELEKLCTLTVYISCVMTRHEQKKREQQDSFRWIRSQKKLISSPSIHR